MAETTTPTRQGPIGDRHLVSQERFFGFVESRLLPIRKIVFGEPCPYCNGVCDSLEHVIPLSEAKGLMMNTVGACKKCNNTRRSVPFLIWWGLQIGSLKRVCIL